MRNVASRPPNDSRHVNALWSLISAGLSRKYWRCGAVNVALVALDAEDPSPERAQELTQTVAETFTSYVRELETSVEEAMVSLGALSEFVVTWRPAAGGVDGFEGFLGSGAYVPGASSSVLCSAVSNSALKRTRILRAAYLGR